jgi:hypothetical protein
MVKQNGTNLATPQDKPIVHPIHIPFHTTKIEITMGDRRK